MLVIDAATLVPSWSVLVPEFFDSIEGEWSVFVFKGFNKEEVSEASEFKLVVVATLSVVWVLGAEGMLVGVDVTP